MVRYLILGAGGAGRTIASACEHLEGGIGFLDDWVTVPQVNGFPVLGKIEARANYREARYIVGFGTRALRERRELFHKLRDEGFEFFNAVAPQAFIDRNATLGIGIMIAAQSAVLPNATIRDNCNICAGCTIDHDVRLGEGVYLSPGVNLAGTVEVEEGAFIGTNATILPGVHIGAWATVGAGAVVLHDVAPADVVVGVPAKTLRRRGQGKK